MSGRRSSAVNSAVNAVLKRGMHQTEAARKYGCTLRSVQRALREDGIAPKPEGRPRKETAADPLVP